jgi:ribose-phosphate pyrophosphokinase
MKKLNLAYPEQSDIQFKISKFPDGQQTIDLLNSRGSVQGTDVVIYSRIKNFCDIELIIAANQLLRELAVKTVHLYVPYFLGARSDRKFHELGINYLKTVICPVINSQKFDSVIVLDPHSNVLEGCLNNFEKVNNHLIVKYALMHIDNKPEAQSRIVLVSPDAGAYGKIFDVAQNFDIRNVVTAMKHRDIKTGQITHTEVPNIDQYGENHKFVIIDDICDGGRTFIELAKAIRKHNAISEIYLIVTHGIFSAGFDELGKHFTKIYSSNSYSDINVLTMNYNTDKGLLMQFDVFNK